MAINDLNGLVAALAGGAYRLPFQKNSITSAVAGHEMSLWLGVGYPTAGTAPGAAAICNAATAGALPLAARSVGQERILASLSFANLSSSGHSLLIEDRLGHMSGLSGTVTTAQTVSLDLNANLGVSNLAERIGTSDFSEVEWCLEWYTATGATVSTPTANVTFHDATTGTVNAWVAGGTALPATVAASRRYKLAPTNGKFIRSVESVTLSASTGTAGNFGVTAVRRLAECHAHEVSRRIQMDWSSLTGPVVPDNACVTFGQAAITTSTGAWAGLLVQAVA